MMVAEDGALTEDRAITSGVPQESVLGLVLFQIYIHQVTNNLVAFVKAFANDY